MRMRICRVALYRVETWTLWKVALKCDPGAGWSLLDRLCRKCATESWRKEMY